MSILTDRIERQEEMRLTALSEVMLAGGSVIEARLTGELFVLERRSGPVGNLLAQSIGQRRGNFCDRINVINVIGAYARRSPFPVGRPSRMADTGYP